MSDKARLHSSDKALSAQVLLILLLMLPSIYSQSACGYRIRSYPHHSKKTKSLTPGVSYSNKTPFPSLSEALKITWSTLSQEGASKRSLLKCRAKHLELSISRSQVWGDTFSDELIDLKLKLLFVNPNGERVINSHELVTISPHSNVNIESQLYLYVERLVTRLNFRFKADCAK